MSAQSNTPSKREVTVDMDGQQMTLKKYVLGIYLRGTAVIPEDQLEELQKRHLAHLDSLAKTGVLLMAGPFENGGDKRGLMLFDVGTKEEAAPLMDSDPAVKAGRMTYELIEWWTKPGVTLK